MHYDNCHNTKVCIYPQLNNWHAYAVAITNDSASIFFPPLINWLMSEKHWSRQREPFAVSYRLVRVPRITVSTEQSN